MKKKSYWIYGLLMGLLLLVMQIFHYKTMIRDVQIELFGGVVATIFMGLGIWLGLQWVKVKEQRKVDKARAQASQLSDRELDVLKLLAEGCSNQEIADRLFVSLNTIKTHLSNSYVKLGVTRRIQAVQKAQEMGILTSSERVKSSKSPESMTSGS